MYVSGWMAFSQVTTSNHNETPDGDTSGVSLWLLSKHSVSLLAK